KTLTKGEELELGKRAQLGDKVAIDKLVLANLKFAVQVARRYQGLGFPIEDLMSTACIGLCNAAKIYNPEKNVKFTSFAVWHIRHEINALLNDQSRIVRVPISGNRDQSYVSTSAEVTSDEGDSTESYADRYLSADNGKTES